MTNKEFIKRDIHFKNKRYNNQKKNVIVQILDAFTGLCGLAATVCWIILLIVIAVLTLGQGFGSKYSNRCKNKYGITVYK